MFRACTRCGRFPFLLAAFSKFTGLLCHDLCLPVTDGSPLVAQSPDKHSPLDPENGSLECGSLIPNGQKLTYRLRQLPSILVLIMLECGLWKFQTLDIPQLVLRLTP